MKKIFRPDKFFENKTFTIILSLLLAIGIWVVVTVTQNPNISITFSDIPINYDLSNTVLSSTGLKIVNNNTQTISLTVYGKSYFVSTLKASDFEVTPIYANVTSPGTYDLLLNVSVNNGFLSDYQINNVSPNRAHMKLDYYVTKTFTVNPIAHGAQPSDSTLIVASPIITKSSQGTITITGPQSEVNLISTVNAVANVNAELSSTQTYKAAIQLLDSNGNAISDKSMTLGFDSANITVPVVMQKTVPLVPTFTNQPNEFNISILNYLLNQQTITVEGSPDAINALSSVNLDPIDFTKISLTNDLFNQSVSPLPSGITSVGTQSKVNVKMNFAGYAEKTFSVNKLSLINSKSSFNITQSRPITVTLIGPSTILSVLTSADLSLNCDVSSITQVGQYQLSCSVSTGHSNVWAVGSYNVFLNAK